jgi:hypothetical protein
VTTPPKDSEEQFYFFKKSIASFLPETKLKETIPPNHAFAFSNFMKRITWQSWIITVLFWMIVQNFSFFSPFSQCLCILKCNVFIPLSTKSYPGPIIAQIVENAFAYQVFLLHNQSQP